MILYLSCFFLGHRHYKIVSSMDNYTAILTTLREEGITFETDGGFELIPLTPIEVCQYIELFLLS